MNKHTPEPTPPCDCIERTENGSWWAYCYCSNRGDEVSATIWCTDENNKAKLEALRAINADLLEALKALRDAVKNEPAMQNREKYLNLGIQVNNAIAKAEGRT